MFNFFKKKTSTESAEPIDKIGKIAPGDQVLRSYQEKAQDDLPYLIDFMTQNGNGVEKYGEVMFKYAVKMRFNEGDNAEHMWVQVNEIADGMFIGTLANKPNTIQLIKHGDPVNVPRADIEDWVLQDLLTGTKVGGFSSGYIRNAAEHANKTSK